MTFISRGFTAADGLGALNNELFARYLNLGNAQSIIAGAIRGEYNTNIVVLGDSYVKGSGSSSIPQLSWCSHFRDVVNENGAGGYGFEDSFNLDPSDQCSGITSTNGTFTGTSGPLKYSLQMTVGQTLVFGGNYHYIDFFFERSAGAGSVSIVRDADAAVVKSFAGATASNICTYNGTTVSTKNKNSVWTVTCTVAPIEITGLIRRQITAAGAKFPFLSRVGKGGYNSADFAAAPQIASLLAIGQYDSSKAVYVIATGTNDIFTSGKQLSSVALIANYRTIITGLSNSGSTCVLTIPAAPDPAFFPALLEPLSNYRTAILALCNELGLGVIDFSQFNLVNQSAINADHLHPNDYGHSLYAKAVLKALDIPSLKPIFRYVEDLVLQDVWLSADTTPPRVKIIGNIAKLEGGVLRNGSVSAACVNITSSFARPDVLRAAATAGGGADVPYKITIATNGNINVNLVTNVAAYFDGVEYPIKQALNQY